MDRVGSFLAEKTPRRFLALATFVTLLYLFRGFAALIVFFVAIERSMTFVAGELQKRSKLGHKSSVLVTILALTTLLGLFTALGIGRAVGAYERLHAALPQLVAELRENRLIQRIHDDTGDRLIDGFKHFSGQALRAATEVGHWVFAAILAYILAAVFLLQRDELQEFYNKLRGPSFQGTLLRWLVHVADATVLTVQLQVIGALCSTVMILPVLLLLGIPHIGTLMVLIFVSGLIPVVGNLVSGVVLAVLAYQTHGGIGVGVVLAITLVVHKIEEYYLKPRITARHVNLPGFLLILSLLACEELLGFVGLFLSFPILFVTGRIRQEFAEETRLERLETGRKGG
ncbi:MAG: AI-2E family transporter [Myxococcales bacterium]